jgi:hypothetical protein
VLQTSLPQVHGTGGASPMTLGELVAFLAEKVRA